MSLFVPKEWKDRLVEFAGRRKLTNVATGEEIIVDVARNEGAVSQEGDAVNAANFNDLEQRVKEGFDKVDAELNGEGGSEMNLYNMVKALYDDANGGSKEIYSLRTYIDTSWAEARAIMSIKNKNYNNIHMDHAFAGSARNGSNGSKTSVVDINLYDENGDVLKSYNVVSHTDSSAGTTSVYDVNIDISSYTDCTTIEFSCYSSAQAQYRHASGIFGLSLS